jgi:hypothetical protein
MYNNRPANNYYQPMVNVPTLNRLPTHGEVVASIELLIAQVGELSRKIDRVESRVNDWVNLSLAERMVIAENGISALKTCHNDNTQNIIGRFKTTENEIDDLFGYIKEIKDDAREDIIRIDRFSDILTEHSSKLRHAKNKTRNLTKKCAEIGVLRRRVSKCEEFNTEFVECFEAPLQLRGIVSNMSDKVDECDRTITHMIRYGDAGTHHYANTMLLPEDSTFWKDDERDDEMPTLDAINEYLSNYGDVNDNDVVNTQKNEVQCDDIEGSDSADEFVTL